MDPAQPREQRQRHGTSCSKPSITVTSNLSYVSELSQTSSAPAARQPACCWYLPSRKDIRSKPAIAFQGTLRIPQKGKAPGFLCTPWHHGWFCLSLGSAAHRDGNLSCGALPCTEPTCRRDGAGWVHSAVSILGAAWMETLRPGASWRRLEPLRHPPVGSQHLPDDREGEMCRGGGWSVALSLLKGRELIVATLQLSWKLHQPPQCLIFCTPCLQQREIGFIIQFISTTLSGWSGLRHLKTITALQ